MIALWILLGIVIGVVSMMILRTLLYNANKLAYDYEMQRLEDEQLLKDYEDAKQ